MKEKELQIYKENEYNEGLDINDQESEYNDGLNYSGIKIENL